MALEHHVSAVKVLHILSRQRGSCLAFYGIKSIQKSRYRFFESSILTCDKF